MLYREGEVGGKEIRAMHRKKKNGDLEGGGRGGGWDSLVRPL